MQPDKGDPAGRATPSDAPTSRVSMETAPASGSSVAPDFEALRGMARTIRRDIVLMTAEAGSGHPGGSLSAVEILTLLYFHIMRLDPANPRWPDRDRFILSKAHACPVLYSALARRGFFPVEELKTFRRLNSRLQGHAHIKTPGVEFSSGSLGQGLSFGIGVALAGRLDRKDYHVYVLLGDGECDEGQVWEAAMAAAHYHLANLTAFVDRNRIQNDRFTSQAMELEPLAEKWRAFGWNIIQVGSTAPGQDHGHDLAALYAAVQTALATKGKPTVIIAHTTKGKGVSFMENNPDFHGRAPTKEELARALAEMEGQR